MDVLSLTKEQLEEITKKALLEALDSELQGLPTPTGSLPWAWDRQNHPHGNHDLYDFILAEHYPEDGRFAKNALVFALTPLSLIPYGKSRI